MLATPRAQHSRPAGLSCRLRVWRVEAGALLVAGRRGRRRFRLVEPAAPELLDLAERAAWLGGGTVGDWLAALLEAIARLDSAPGAAA